MDLQGDVLAGAERSAHPGEGEVDVGGCQAERLGDLALVVVQPLGGDEQLHAAVDGGHRQARLGAHESLVLHADLVVALHDHVAGGGGVAVADADVAEHVAVGVDGRGVGGGGGVGDGVQRLVVHDDGFGSQQGGLGMVGGHQRHRFAAVADDVGGEDRLVGVLDAEDARSGQVVGGQHGPHTADGQGGGDVDGADAGVGVRRAQRPAPQHAVGPQVRGEGEGAGGLGDAVGPRNALADAPGGAGPYRRLHTARGASVQRPPRSFRPSIRPPLAHPPRAGSPRKYTPNFTICQSNRARRGNRARIGRRAALAVVDEWSGETGARRGRAGRCRRRAGIYGTEGGVRGLARFGCRGGPFRTRSRGSGGVRGSSRGRDGRPRRPWAARRPPGGPPAGAPCRRRWW